MLYSTPLLLRTALSARRYSVFFPFWRFGQQTQLLLHHIIHWLYLSTYHIMPSQNLYMILNVAFTDYHITTNKFPCQEILKKYFFTKRKLYDCTNQIFGVCTKWHHNRIFWQQNRWTEKNDIDPGVNAVMQLRQFSSMTAHRQCSWCQGHQKCRHLLIGGGIHYIIDDSAGIVWFQYDGRQ